MDFVINRLSEVLKHLVTRHPTSGDLQSFLDCELEPLSRSRVKRHVATCSNCRTELENLKMGLQLYLDMDARQKQDDVLAILEGFANLQAALGASEPAVAQMRSARDRWLHEQLSSEVQAYLGQQATLDLLEQTGANADPRLLLKAAQPLLVTFLGKKACGRIEERFNGLAISTT